MKRGKPLKRTPLKPGKSKLQQRTPLKYRSKKTEEKYIERRDIVSEMLKETPKCKACIIFKVYDNDNAHSCIVVQRPTQDVHELINRSQGGSILDYKNLIAVCRSCHSRITTNPKEAETLGLHLESWCNTEKHFMESLRVRESWISGKPTFPFWMVDNEQ